MLTSKQLGASAWLRITRLYDFGEGGPWRILDELVQREKQAERRRRTRANAIAVAMGVLALGAAGASVVAVLNQNKALQAEALATTNAERADRERGIAEDERDRADYNFQQAEIQRLAARRGEAEARNALARIYADRAWQAAERGEYSLAMRYALAGARSAPSNEAEYRAVLNSLIFHSRQRAVFEGHGSAATSVTFDASGDRMLSATRDGDAMIWVCEGVLGSAA